jgi:hypothetical protein
LGGFGADGAGIPGLGGYGQFSVNDPTLFANSGGVSGASQTSGAGGFFSGFTFNFVPTTVGFIGAGVSVDSNGNYYPELSIGTPGEQFIAGYTNNLQGLLSGPSFSASIGGDGSIMANIGASTSTMSGGIGTAGFGLTYGFGPFSLSQMAGMVDQAIGNVGAATIAVPPSSAFGMD